MTQQQEMWYRHNLARRQAMMAAIMRMRYSAAGGSAGSEKKSEDVVVPSIPMPEKTTLKLIDGTAHTIDEIDPSAVDQVVELIVGPEFISDDGTVFNMPGNILPNLRSLVIPDGPTVVEIGQCNITELTVPNTAQDCVIYECPNLKTLTLGSGVEELVCVMDESPEIRISKANEHIKKEGGFIVSTDGSRLMTAIDENTRSGNVTIPDGVTSIGGGAFAGCSGLTGVTIPNSVTSIGVDAFSYCGLTNVTIPNSVTSIGGGAFSYCSGLTSVTIPNSVTTIDGTAFSDCSGLTSVTIPDSVTSIEYGTFQDCNRLTNVTIPNSVTNIGEYAFYNCSGLTSVTIPDSVTSIDGSAFTDCSNLSTVNMENRTTEYVQNMENFSWGLGAYYDTEGIGHTFQVTIRCSDGDVAINAPSIT